MFNNSTPTAHESLYKQTPGTCVHSPAAQHGTRASRFREPFASTQPVQFVFYNSMQRASSHNRTSSSIQSESRNAQTTQAIARNPGWLPKRGQGLGKPKKRESASTKKLFEYVSKYALNLAEIQKPFCYCASTESICEFAHPLLYLTSPVALPKCI